MNMFEIGLLLDRKRFETGGPDCPSLVQLYCGCFLENVRKGTEGNLISGIFPAFLPGGVVNLHYADDTLLFLQKCSQSCFEPEIDPHLFSTTL
jgi:hypothetical protein